MTQRDRQQTAGSNFSDAAQPPTKVAYFVFRPALGAHKESVLTGVTEPTDDKPANVVLTSVKDLAQSDQAGRGIPVFTARKNAETVAALIPDSEVRTVQDRFQPQPLPDAGQKDEGELAANAKSKYAVPAGVLPITNGRMRPEPAVVDMVEDAASRDGRKTYTAKKRGLLKRLISS